MKLQLDHYVRRLPDYIQSDQFIKICKSTGVSVLLVLLAQRLKLLSPIVLTISAPFVAIIECIKSLQAATLKTSASDECINEAAFPDEDEFQRILHRIGAAGPRTTGNQAHNELIDWLERELREIPGLSIRTDEYDILRWQTTDSASLKDAGTLRILGTEGHEVVPIAGAVPFSKPCLDQRGSLVYLPSHVPISEQNARGNMVLRDFPKRSIAYQMIFLQSLFKTTDLSTDMFRHYDRPGFADGIIKEELLDAGRAGAMGVIFMFDVERVVVESYFEPHQGVHFSLPAVYVGADEAVVLKEHAVRGDQASLTISAEVSTAKTRNFSATLAGQTKERVIYESHTDGNTYVQENGPVALLALARYFAKQPISSRKRTLEFAFNTGHLHISREGTHRHAVQLDSTFDNGEVTLIVPVEHLGTREIEARPRASGKPGVALEYTGRGELMFWCVGPSSVVRDAVRKAVTRRRLDRVLVAPGVSMPDKSRVPTYSSFGGIGSYYHNQLLPTTSLISGPWSLWAPHFGADAIDMQRFRSQTLALGDIYLAIENVSREDIVDGYFAYRRRRAKGTNVAASFIPYEVA
ncbi:hypothetical protein BKA63DRAFT_494430 [Paraphoma chrysanthemicola]|nr:hypothetical protein BKA63DRAFT_494430 [Paraphoma chrysanthemicola]